MKLLFICTHNRCRSILAEAVTNHLADGRIAARSAGSQPAAAVHPLSLQYLHEQGIASDGLQSQSWEIYRQWSADVIITLCDTAAGEACPIWFGNALRVHWGLADPSAVQGSDKAIASAFRHTIELLTQRINALLQHPFETLQKDGLSKLFNAIGKT